MNLYNSDITISNHGSGSDYWTIQINDTRYDLNLEKGTKTSWILVNVDKDVLLLKFKKKDRMDALNIGIRTAIWDLAGNPESLPWNR